MSRTASILLAATVAAGLGLWWLASTQKESAPAPLARESASSNAPEPAPELGLAAPEPRASAAVPEVPPAPPQPADAAPRATLLVRVVSASERTPLARARLTITSEDPALDRPSVDVNGTHGSLAESPLTDAEGRAEFELPPGAAFTLWTLWIQGGEIAAEAGPRPIPALRPDERREMLVELATGNDLRFCGRVVRRTDRTPVSGARVRGTDAEITTDSDGRFGLQVASWRPPSLRVEATGFGLSVVTPTKGHETPELAFEIALSAGATLEARVLDAVGNPLPGASVRLTARSFELRRASEDALSDFAWVPDEVREAATEPDGRCVLADLAAGVRWSVEVLRDAAVVLREGDPIFLAPGQVLAREWRIGAGGTFAGLALDQHEVPVPQLEIWLAKAGPRPVRFFQPHEAEDAVAKTTTDGAGHFEFRDVAPGSWSIGPGAGTIAEPSKSDAATQASTFEMIGGETVPIRVRVYRNLFVRGLVLDPEGKPQPKAHVWATDEARSGLSTESDDRGGFALGPLAPGRYTLVAFRTAGHAPSDRIDAEAGSEDVVLRLRPGGSLRGRVVDVGTGASCKAQMLAVAQGGRPGWSGGTTGWSSLDDGSFDLTALEPGIYDLSAGTQDGRFGMLRAVGVMAGQETGDLIVSVAPAGWLRIRYEGKQAKPRCRVFADDVQVSFGMELEENEVEKVLAPVGTVEVRLRTAEGQPLETRAVEVRAGETQDVVLGDPR